jgi:glycerol uptake facilitator-like aquaporin
MDEQSFKIGSIRAWKFVSWATLTAIVFMAVWPLDLSAGDPFSIDVGRIFAYAVLGLSLSLGYPRSPKLCAALSFSAAVVDEFLPILLLSHSFRWTDMAGKLIGILLGHAIGWIWNQRRNEDLET